MNKKEKKLQQKWYKLLKREGFEDLEYADGSLKSDGSKQTIGFKNQQETRDYYSWVENIYMAQTLDKRSQAVLPLYVQGVHLTDITKASKLTYAQVRYVVRKARKAYASYFCGLAA